MKIFNVRYSQKWQAATVFFAICFSGYLLLRLPSAFAALNYWMFPCQIASQCAASGPSPAILIFNVICPFILLLSGIWLLTRRSPNAAIIIAVTFAIIFWQSIFNFHAVDILNMLYAFSCCLGIICATFSFVSTAAQYSHIGKAAIIRWAIVLLIIFASLAFAARAYSDFLLVKRIHQVADAWDIQPKNMYLLNEGNTGRKAIIFRKGEYTYSLCGKFSYNTEFLKGIIYDYKNLGASFHQAGLQCFKLKPRPDVFLKQDFEVNKNMVVVDFNHTNNTMMVWNEQPGAGGNPLLNTSTKYFNAQGDAIRSTEVKPGNMADFYWVKDDWYSKVYVNKVVISSSAPDRSYCEKAIMTDNSSSPLCPQTITNMRFVSVKDGVVTTTDHNGKTWYAYYYEHPTPTAETQNGQPLPLTSVKSGRTVDLVWKEGVISVIRLK